MLEILDDEGTLDVKPQKKPKKKKSSLEKLENALPLIDVPQLPSGFKGYPINTTVSYEPMTLKEAELLNSGSINVLRALEYILNAVHSNNIDAEDLAYWDVMYIGVIRKILAFGDIRGQLTEICPECSQTVTHEFTYTELEFLELEAPQLPIIANIGGQELEFGFITFKDFMELEADATILQVYARMVKNKPYKEALQIISNATGKDIKKLSKIEQYLSYGIKPFVHKCSNCQSEVEFEVKTPFEITFPEDTSNDDSDFEIRFGK